MPSLGEEDFAVGPDGADSAAAQAAAAAELIREAEARLDDGRELSLYAVRLALREVRDAVSAASRDSDLYLSDPEARRCLLLSEHAETAHQFRVLRPAMLGLLARCDALAADIAAERRGLLELWERPRCGAGPAAGAADLFEARVRSGRGLGMTPDCLAALRCSAAAYSATPPPQPQPPGGAGDGGGGGFEAMLEEGRCRVEFHAAAVACGVPDCLARDVCGDPALAGPALRALAARAALMAPRHAELCGAVRALSIGPFAAAEAPPPAVRGAARGGGPAADFAAAEAAERQLRSVATAVERWELHGGLPFFLDGPPLPAGGPPTVLARLRAAVAALPPEDA